MGKLNITADAKCMRCGRPLSATEAAARTLCFGCRPLCDMAAKRGALAFQQRLGAKLAHIEPPMRPVAADDRCECGGVRYRLCAGRWRCTACGTTRCRRWDEAVLPRRREAQMTLTEVE
jgi:hypothetical protein